MKIARSRWSSLLAGVLLAVVATTSACGLAYTPDPGPLGTESDPDVRIACLSASGSLSYADASTVLRNTGRDALTITRVKVFGARDVVVSSALLIPSRAGVLGAWPEWPPPIPPSAMHVAAPARGAVIEPSAAYTLVAHLSRAASGPLSRELALRIDYLVGRKQYACVTASTLHVEARLGADSPCA